MIINKPHLCSRLDVWSPRYSDKYNQTGEWVVLLAQYKVQQASPVIIINFTKAKHLVGQRFCMRRDDITRCELDTNGKIACYAVPLSKLERWDSGAEVRDLIENMFA